MKVKIEAVSASASEDWLRLRCALWPESGMGKHREEMAAYFEGLAKEPAAVFLARKESGGSIGLLELSLRAYAEGCDQPNPAYVEGIYVEEAHRRQGIARQLMEFAEDWAREQGCCEIASDSSPENTKSAAMHEASGFRDAGLVQCWIKPLK